MSVEEFLRSHLEEIIDVARFAPSVHNTQPWIVTINENSVVITIDSEHRLHDGDPTGRETIISLGIFAEAICIGAKSLGLASSDVSLKNEVCSISFNLGDQPDQISEDVSLLKERSSDRSVYKHLELAPEILEEIRDARPHPKVSILISSDAALIKNVAKLTSQGIQLALSSPAFRSELSNYLVKPGSHKNRGIATKSLYIPLALQYIEPWLVKSGLANNIEVRLEKRRWESASAVIFICTDGDLHADWFEVGRSYLRASLAIEKVGLSQATSAAIVEASNFHEDVENILGTSRRIQAIIRIGKGKKHRHHSPRVSSKELITTSS